MITKIGTINSLGVFKGFKWDDHVIDEKDNPLDFKRRNVIYGCNYSGKTTLSRIFRALELHQLPERYHEPQFEVVTDKGGIVSQDEIPFNQLIVRVFNEDFVQKNLHFFSNPDGDIEPFAILGAQNREVRAAIDAIEAEIGVNDGESSTGLFRFFEETRKGLILANDELTKAQDDLNRVLGNKATGSAVSIKNKHRKFGDINYTITKLKSDIDEVMCSDLQLLSLEQVKELEAVVDEQKKDEVKLIELSESNMEGLCEQSATLLERKINISSKIQGLIDDAILEIWVKQGISIHIDKEVCLFCGGRISSERWKKITAHFDEESKNLEESLAHLIEKVEKEKDRYSSQFTIDEASYYSEFHKRIDEYVQKYNELRTLQYQGIDQVAKQLNKRKMQISVPLSFCSPMDYYVAMKDQILALNTLIQENNAYSKKLTARIADAQRRLRLQEVAEFCDSINYQDKKRTLSELEVKREEAKRKADDACSLLKEKQEELKRMMSLLSDEEEGARCVNRYLSANFGCTHIQLVPKEVEDADKKFKFQVVREDRPASNLSEGERRLISFCYFIARIKDEMNRGIKPIIWIDDPISSLDGNHIFFIFTLLKSEIVDTNKYEQLFVSTHNLEFLKYLKRLKCNQDNGLECFIVRRKDKNSEIVRMPKYMRRYVTEFNYLFHEILKCSQMETIDDNNYQIVYSFANAARKFLEILMFFSYPEDIPQIDKLKKYFGDVEIPAILVEKANNEYSHLEGNLERACLPIEVPEIVEVSKIIIKAMIKNSPEQYEALLRSVLQDGCGNSSKFIS